MRIVENDSLFIIEKDFSLSHCDIQVLNFLYLPIIKSNALSLYNFLYNYYQLSNHLGEFIHDDIFSLLDMKQADFLLARTTLEGIGLLEVYRKEESSSNNQLKITYIYKLLPPASPKKFFNDILLRSLLNQNVGNKRYFYFQNYFMINKLDDKKEFINVTSQFKDVFSLNAQEGDLALEKVTTSFVDKKYKSQYSFKLSTLIEELSKQQYQIKNIEDKISDIENLCVLYDAKISDVVTLILQNTDSKNVFYFESFSKDIKNLYMFSVDRKNNESSNITQGNMAELISAFENTSPQEFLSLKLHSKVPSFMLKTIEGLKENFNFSNGIINVILDYSLKKSSGEFNDTFINKVASTLSFNQVSDTYDAMTKLKSRDFNVSQYKRKKSSTKKVVELKETKEADEHEIKSLFEDLNL